MQFSRKIMCLWFDEISWWKEIQENCQFEVLCQICQNLVDCGQFKPCIKVIVGAQQQPRQLFLIVYLPNLCTHWGKIFHVVVIFRNHVFKLFLNGWKHFFKKDRIIHLIWVVRNKIPETILELHNSKNSGNILKKKCSTSHQGNVMKYFYDFSFDFPNFSKISLFCTFWGTYPSFKTFERFLRNKNYDKSVAQQSNTTSYHFLHRFRCKKIKATFKKDSRPMCLSLKLNIRSPKRYTLRLEREIYVRRSIPCSDLSGGSGSSGLNLIRQSRKLITILKFPTLTRRAPLTVGRVVSLEPLVSDHGLNSPYNIDSKAYVRNAKHTCGFSWCRHLVKSTYYIYVRKHCICHLLKSRMNLGKLQQHRGVRLTQK